MDRTAEELGRAFPGAPVVVSRADRVLPAVPRRRRPRAGDRRGRAAAHPAGYAAAVLLDGDALLARPDLRAGEEALRRWRAAAALVRPAPDGGLVVVCADPGAAAVEMLVRGDPALFAARELDERASLALPPAVAAATLDGPAGAVASLLAAAVVPPGVETLGPVPRAPRPRHPARTAERSAAPTLDGAEEPVRVILRGPRTVRHDLAAALHAAAAVRSARRDPGVVRVRLDPDDLG